MNLKHVALSLGAVAAAAGSGALGVWLMSLDSNIRTQGTAWLGLLLGPVCLVLVVAFMCLVMEVLGDGLQTWWNWLHRKEDGSSE